MNSEGEISKVVRPGDRAPGGKTFDWAQLPWVNDRGDLVFEGHIKEDPCIQFNPANIPGVQLFCLQSLYARDASTGRIRSIAHIGDKAPGGREPFASAYGGKENNSGQIVFIGGMAADPAGTGHLPLDINTGIFLNSGGRTIAVARPGDAMPGGGTLLTAAAFTNDVWINDAGVISFSAVITDINGDGQEDNGMYLWSEGTLSLVAHTGTVIPGVGTINALKPPALVGVDPRTISGAAINDQGQVLFTAALTDGRGVLLVATPDTNGTATVTSSAKAASSTASTGLVEAIGTWVAGNRANTPSIPAVNAALAGAASPAGLSGAPVAYSSLSSAPLGGTASGGSPSYAALDQLFADLVNDTLLNGLAHAGL